MGMHGERKDDMDAVKGSRSSSGRAESQSIDLFKCRWDALVLEVQTTSDIIGRIDSITQATKNWAVVTWAGSIALLLGQESLVNLMGATALLPIVFWILDAQWRRIQRRAIFRVERISELLSDGDRIKSLASSALGDVWVFDPMGRRYRGQKEYDDFASLTKTLFYKEVYLVYFSMALISIIASIAIYLGWIPLGNQRQ